MKKVLPIIILALLVGIGVSFILLDRTSRDIAPNQAVLKIHFIDIGQGDCSLLQTPDKRNILVDAGGRETAEDVVRYLRRNGVEHIDLVVMTHPHEDHIGGLPRVLEEFGVSSVMDAGYPHASRTYREVLEGIDARKIKYRLARDWVSPHISKDVSIDVVWPSLDYMSGRKFDLNNGSIVLHVKYGETRILLTGCIMFEAENGLLAEKKDIQSTILKVAHHGSANSTSNEFLEVVQPEFAVISVGRDNSYGHPAPSLLRRLKATGAHIYRTDRDGSVVLSSDGNMIQAETSR